MDQDEAQSARLTGWRGWRDFGLLLGSILLATIAHAQALHQGLPPTHVIEAPLEATPSFYAVAQSPEGVLFLGGSDGVLSYDGRNWTTTRMPNGRFVRSLKHDGDRRLYVGGYAQFGYIELDAAGEPVFTDLTPPLDSIVDADNLADIWKMEVTPEGVFFSALFHLFRYQPESGELDVWHHPGRLGGLIWHEEELLIQYRGSGLRRYEDGDFHPVPGGEQLLEHVVAFLPLPEGGLLTMGRDGLWRRFHRGHLTHWPAPATLPSPENFDAHLVLPDGSFALGAPDGTVHVLDPDTRVHRAFRIGSGFVSDLSLAVDGGILVQTDLETSHFLWPSSWTRLGPESGLLGRIHRMLPWQGQWLAITNAGVQRFDGRRFEATGWSSFETWDWLTLPSGQGMLADSYDLLEIDPRGDAIKRIENLYPRTLLPSPDDEQLVFVGTELGLAIVDVGESGWRLRFRQEGFTGLVEEILPAGRSELLLSVVGHGLVRARFDPDWERLLDWRVFSEAEGLNYGPDQSVSIVPVGERAWLLSTASGFFQFDGSRAQPAQPVGLPEPDPTATGFKLVRSPRGELWAFRQRELWRQREDGAWLEQDLTPMEPSIVASLSFAEDGQVLVGDQATVLQFEPDIQAIEPAPVSVRLRQVLLTDAQGETRLLPLSGQGLALPHDITSLRFDYGVPSFGRAELHRYRSRMHGYEEDFSDWGRTTRITFSQLEPGVKRFEVEALDSQGRLSRIEPYEFEILPAWYGTLWARILWVLLGLLLFLSMIHALIRWRVRRFEAESRRLSEMVEQRTAELAAANRKLENMANVDGLTGVANRRRLDEYLAEAWQRCQDRACDLAVVLIDVDHFKRYNDTHGHQAGDEALRQVADLLARHLRRNEDVVARYGGEEFMVVLPAADRERAAEVAEHLRQVIESGPLGLTASLGVASVKPGPKRSLKALIERADQALYRAKDGGRNRVEVDES
ncbi:ligand-binding sensor domain-containing diguanylate cyclase [Wenzhouxiangella marina]|uniref:diguanylate cyclase n=1 Tax=Wenzhouxiangella marina TaxID=1579979 RepID=A0A0K0Y0G1_9GAMM|nr:GGDEF domain-containing protein [Wenzhouxiangella marina]AKS43410.1 hypothetical protein WM2015_3058 [Wenzhouxiangella marina]MBB6088296.1 diguanylate cyclase (GGDEF)-like protein [Wenzhouxiangella marina]